MRFRWSFWTNLFSRFQRPFWIVKIPHVILSPKFHLQLKINSGYPSLQSHNEGLQLLPYNIDLLKTKILVNLSRITPFYGTLINNPLIRRFSFLINLVWIFYPYKAFRRIVWHLLSRSRSAAYSACWRCFHRNISFSGGN
jgi:hypothetical protein